MIVGNHPYEYHCRDCTGRGGEIMSFGGEMEPTHCPFCGQISTVETTLDYYKRIDQ